MASGLNQIDDRYESQRQGLARAAIGAFGGTTVQASVASVMTGDSQENMMKLTCAFGTGPSFDGGGFTGLGSRSGGLDGQVRFWSLSHPQETEIDYNNGRSVGGVTNHLNVTVSMPA